MWLSELSWNFRFWTQCMVRPCVEESFVELADVRSYINVSGFKANESIFGQRHGPNWHVQGSRQRQLMAVTLHQQTQENVWSVDAFEVQPNFRTEWPSGHAIKAAILRILTLAV